MRNLFTITQKIKDKSEKLDRFFFTYFRVFEENDTIRFERRERINKLWYSLAIGPFPLIATLAFPYDLVYQVFGEIHQVYMVPFYVFVFAASRELFGQMSFRQELRFKQKVYNQYKEKVELTKDQVIEIEEAIKREMLRLEMKNNEK
jgi:hypothetical protein